MIKINLGRISFRSKSTTFILLVLSIITYNYCVELLTDAGVPAEQIMFYRGGSALILGIMVGLMSNYSLYPKSPKIHIARLLLNAASSYLTILSFSYLSASTVVLVGRTDIPILIFFSVISGIRKSNLQFWLSIWTVSVIIFLAMDAKFIDEEPIGFLFAFASVFMTSMGYWLVKKASANDNIYVISNVFSFANLCFGAILILSRNGSFAVDASNYWIFLLSGITQLGTYYFGISMYKWYNVEQARIPFIAAGFFIMILEMIVEHKIFSTSQIALSLLITGMLLTIVLDPASPNKNIRGTESL